MAKKKQDDTNKTELVGFLGVGLDNKDGHSRVTKSDNFLLVGGSAETHERMQDVAVHFDDSLEKTGKSLPEAEVEEVLDLLRRAFER